MATEHFYALARELVGDITPQDLQYVDWYVCKDMGIFIPSVGYCGYAVQYRHTHPAYSLVVLSGETGGVLKAEFAPDQNHYLAAMLSPGIPHEEEAGDAFSRYIAIFASQERMQSVCDSIGVPVPRYEVWHQFPIPKNIMVMLERFMAEAEAAKPGSGDVLQALATIILHDFVRCSHRQQPQATARYHSGIQAALDRIQQDYAQVLSVAMLAETAKMSATTFSRQFKAFTGQSPGSCLLRIRLEKARKLLQSGGDSITGIALQCGFSNTAHLTALFKRHYGMPPSVYRATHRL